jgi:hypothetical protein
MSNISGGRRRYERVEFEVPLQGCQPSSTPSGARDIYGLIARIEDAAKERGVNTNYDDWFHVDAYEDDRLVFWFELPNATKWVNESTT